MKQAIHVVGNQPPILFAARELARYLRIATGKTLRTHRIKTDQPRQATFMVGPCENLGIRRPRHLGKQDDWVRIKPHDHGYVLTGSNPRSVLFAVYRYLRECGFKWIRPGSRGQIIPDLRSTVKRGLNIKEKASYPYRTICTEGGCSRQHAIDLIDWMAKVDGKRDLWRRVPLNTNLCYSNTKVRAAVTDSITQYAKDNPQVDAIHFWLADNSNNHCECRHCRQARPSDFFVQMLNQLDEKLRVKGLDTKIIFLIYLDLFWPPLRQRIRNTDRFILMFAPITRSYTSSFYDVGKSRTHMAPFKRNHLQFPHGVTKNIAHLRAWQRQFGGEGFDFDYHLIWACYQDFNHFTLATTLHRDLHGLKDIGLDGFNSYQVQRQFFPHGLLMDVLATTLWNRQTTLKSIVNRSFADTFGRDGAKVASFFREMSRLHKLFFDPVFCNGPIFIPTSLRSPPVRLTKQALVNVAKMQQKDERLIPLVNRNLKRNTGAVHWS